ncbi:MAG: SURF1 family protein [Psychromonas sp.]
MKLPILPSSIVLVVVAVCIGLADWQWRRAHQKQQRLDDIQIMQDKGVLDWQNINLLPSGLNKTGLQLTMKGKLQPGQYWLLDNRTLNGQHGYDLLAVFTPEGSEQGLLVNFGWITQGGGRDFLPSIQLPSETFSISVQLKQGDLAGFYLDGAEYTGSGWPKLVQFIDLSQKAEQTGIELVNYMAYAVNSNNFAQPHYEPVVMPPEKHFAYALQWLLIALSAIAVFLFAMRSQSKNKKIISEVK